MNSSKEFGKRKREVYNFSNLSEGMEEAKDLFYKGNYFETFDLMEELVDKFIDESIEILNQVYQYNKLLPSRARYNLYQGRYFNFGIMSGDKVLDIGSGYLPFPFATHLSDILVNNSREITPFKFVEGKPVYECNVENLPFEDKEFDFVYCSHVLEHVCEPERACNELMRIGKKGFIETPTKGKDLWLNSVKSSNHKWAVENINNRLVFTEYSQVEIEAFGNDIIMDMYRNPETDREKALSALIYLKANLVNTMLLWEEDFEYEIHRIDKEIG